MVNYEIFFLSFFLPVEDIRRGFGIQVQNKKKCVCVGGGGV